MTGDILDDNLNRLERRTELCTSLIKISNYFKIIKHQIFEQNTFLLYLYDTYTFSKIQYGIQVYGRTASYFFKKVQSQLNRAVIILFCVISYNSIIDQTCVPVQY